MDSRQEGHRAVTRDFVRTGRAFVPERRAAAQHPDVRRVVRTAACHAAAAGGEWPSTHSTLGNVDERSPEEVGGAAGRVAPDGSRLDCAPRTHRIHSYVNDMPLY